MLNVLTIVCPPLAVLATGQLGKAAINLGLTLMFYLPGVLHARNEVERYDVAKRYDAIAGAMARY